MSRVLITAQLRLFSGMALLQPCCRDYKRFMIRHDKGLYKHNQDFMEGNQGFFHCSCLAQKWKCQRTQNAEIFWSYHWEGLVLNPPFFFGRNPVILGEQFGSPGMMYFPTK